MKLNLFLFFFSFVACNSVKKVEILNPKYFFFNSQLKKCLNSKGEQGYNKLTNEELNEIVSLFNTKEKKDYQLTFIKDEDERAFFINKQDEFIKKIAKNEIKNPFLTCQDFNSMELNQFVFQNVSLTGSVFKNAFLKKVKFINVEARFSDFSFAQMKNTQIIQSDFENAYFQNTQLSHSVLLHSKFKETRFDGAVLEEAQILNSSFYKAVFYRSFMRKIVIKESLCRACLFYGAQLIWAQFEKNDLRLSQFPQIQFYKSSWLNNDLFGVYFEPMMLEKYEMLSQNTEKEVDPLEVPF